MKARDFCYWLQGYFEIADSSELNSRQIEIISNHLKMVFIYENLEVHTKTLEFCFWMQGILQAIAITKASKEPSAYVPQIKAKIAEIFIHEIDPTFGAENQVALNLAHNPQNVNGERC